MIALQSTHGNCVTTEFAESSGMVAQRDADACFARIHTETATVTVGGVAHAQFGGQFSPTHVQARAVSSDFLVLNEVFHDDEYPPARSSDNAWLSGSRWRRLCMVGMLLIPATISAQARPAEDPAKSLKSLQDQIDQARRQRLELEAASERALAADIDANAKRLAMSGETAALHRLEFLLDSTQARLLVQRDRLRSLRQTATTAAQQVAVVTLRADVLPAGDISVRVLIDGVPVKAIDYRGSEGRALTAGAAVELYRGSIDPVAHKVDLWVTGRGLVAGQTITLPAGVQPVNSAEFVLARGRLLPSSGAGKVPTP